MKLDKFKEYLTEFPEVKEDCIKLMDSGYTPFSVSIDISEEDGQSKTTLSVQLKHSNGRKIMLSQGKVKLPGSAYNTVGENAKTTLSTSSPNTLESLPNSNDIKYPNIKLTESDINIREFSKSFMGYNADEVDDFLDAIARDYREIGNYIRRIKENK
jgi:DivIVA domain